MQQKPNGWPKSSAVEILPSFYLRMAYSQWPPAGDETPQGVAPISSWSVDRELTGSNLPGQVRGPSGFSIATGSVVFPQPQGAPLSPWARGSLQLGPGGLCSLYATHKAGEQLNLGKFFVAPISGSSTSNTVSLDLEDHSIQLRRPYSLTWRYDPLLANLDAAWVVAQIAERNGFLSTPTAPSGTVFNAPLVGSAEVVTGTLASVPALQWESGDGLVGMGNVSRIWGRLDGFDQWTRELGIAAQVSGRGGMVLIGAFTVDIRDNYVLIRDSVGELGRFELPQKTSAIRDVMVSLARVSANKLGVRIGEPGGSWSARTDFTTLDPVPLDTADIPVAVTTYGYGGGANVGRWINGVRMWEHSGTSVPAATTITAYIEHTMSTLSGVFNLQNRSSWEVLQEIAASTLGAVWVDEQGSLIYRNREGLRQREFTETIEALDSLESLEWTVDPGDVADRVEVNYTPADVFSGANILTIWEATSRIRVGAGLTVTLRLDIPGSTDRISGFMPLWDESEAPNRFSRWMASTLIDGSGVRPADNALSFSWEIVGGSVIELRITNRTNQGLWLVDSSGDPYLIIRTNRHVAPGETQSISSGASESNSITPLSINAGEWVQDAAVAQEILNFARSQTARAQAVLPRVRVKPDLARQLGDIVRLTDGHTDLVSKAIITGIHLTGGEAGYEQRLDLGLLDPVFTDFDKTLTAQEITTFEQLEALLISAGVSTFEEFDEWLRDLGGTL